MKFKKTSTTNIFQILRIRVALSFICETLHKNKVNNTRICAYVLQTHDSNESVKYSLHKYE